METKTKAYLDIGLDFEELRSTKRSSALGHCQALTLQQDRVIFSSLLPGMESVKQLLREMDEDYSPLQSRACTDAPLSEAPPW